MMKPLILLVVLVSAALLRAGQTSYSIDRNDSAVAIKAGGAQPAVVYHLKKPADIKLPIDTVGFFHPMRTPSGRVMTVAGHSDHPHHRGIFLGWVEMHGKKDADFWGWGEHAPIKNRRIVNRSVDEIFTRSTGALFTVANDWMADDEPLLREHLEVGFKTIDQSNVLDLKYTLKTDADVTLSRWAFSGFCVRLIKEGKLAIDAPAGSTVAKLPTPVHTKPETGWPAAKWYGYTLTFDDNTSAGIAVIDHPSNPPALWHNHTGIRMLNPCIVAPAAVTIKANTPLVLRYRVVAHDGPADANQLDQLALEFSQSK